jgi:hypothetical protein
MYVAQPPVEMVEETVAVVWMAECSCWRQYHQHSLLHICLPSGMYM